MCKWSSGIPLIHFSECEFFRLNPRFVSTFAMVKETFKRIQKMKRFDLKYLKLIPGKGRSKNKPTCENAVSQTLYGSCTLRVMGSCYKLVYLSLVIVCSSKLTVFASRNRYGPRTNIRAYFRAKWRLLYLLSFKSFLATRAVLKIGEYLTTIHRSGGG